MPAMTERQHCNTSYLPLVADNIIPVANRIPFIYPPPQSGRSNLVKNSCFYSNFLVFCLFSSNYITIILINMPVYAGKSSLRSV